MKKLHKQITLEMTCGACPEAYNAYFRGEYVGSLRLRYGLFSVRDDFNNLLYQDVISDNLVGIFPDDKSRKKFLKIARKRLARELEKD